MLSKQNWLRLAPAMEIEWTQCMQEGLEVDAYRARCAALADEASKVDIQDAAPYETAARALADELHACPTRAGYAYDEPDALDEIRARRPERPVPVSAAPDEQRLRAAWEGRIAGCLLGKPVEGWRRPALHTLWQGTGNWPLRRYMRRAEFTDTVRASLGERLECRCWADTVDGVAPIDDDTNYTVLALKLLETRGRDFTSEDVLEAWARNLPLLATCTAERVAYVNGLRGLTVPETATSCNPYREWIGAQIRGDLYGYICPGDPERAAEYAWRDARISHVKNGIYGEMFVAAMLAAAAVTDDVDILLDAGLGEIPAGCRLAEAIGQVRSWVRDGANGAAVIERIHAVWDENRQHDWCHTISNAMIVTGALLCGGGDFGRSVCLAVQAAFDTDCNGATVGSIVGMMRGTVPDEWVAPFARGLETSIPGYAQLTPEALAARTANLARA